MIHALHPYVAFGVMPLFAFANAGVVLGGADFTGDSLWIFLGIILGLAAGKPIGIVAASLVSTKTGLANRSPEMWTGGLALVGVVGGIGFTMSLFIANLAFRPGPQLDTAKLGILVGSGVAMIIGLAYGAFTLRGRTASAP